MSIDRRSARTLLAGGSVSILFAVVALCLFSSSALAATGVITGTVTDASSHAPIQNLEVNFYDSTGNGMYVCTGADGTYAVSVPAGTYRVGFADNSGGCANLNYLRQFYNDKGSLATADPVSVTAGATTAGIDAAMQNGGRISGTVTDASTNMPVASVSGTLTDSGGITWTISGTISGWSVTLRFSASGQVSQTDYDTVNSSGTQIAGNLGTFGGQPRCLS